MFSELPLRTSQNPVRRALPQGEQAYSLLRDRIISLEHKPGEYLNIASLVDETGFGRTPINQALQRLASEGLVSILPRKGILIAPLSIDSALDLIEVRIVNERLSARLAARHIDEESIERLRAAAAGFESAVESNTMSQIMNSDRMFHETMVSIAANQHLADILNVLHAQSQRFWAVSLSAPQHVGEVIVEHRHIVDAIAKGDADLAADCVETHIRSFRLALTGR
jgi:DNA-binding GntR family transcriptional regulator